MSERPDHDPASAPGSGPRWAGHHETQPAYPGRLTARFIRRGEATGQASPPGRRAGQVAVALGALALVTSLAVVGGVVGIAAIVVGMRARAEARRGGAGGGAGTVGLALGALSLLIAFTIASGMWVFYERHGDDLHQYQECRRVARSDAELEDCSRRFSDAVRTDPTSKG
ncbi:hypothetical protein [Frankia sp. R43]|uniref:hypothetical protein n=1 Tax=Frankia sp. R43 TaxID=269536 RepID=UPI0009F98FFE|nr:hypothetical protein [Frankia sp. R43]